MGIRSDRGWFVGPILAAGLALASPALAQDPGPAGPKPRRPLVDVAEATNTRAVAAVDPIRDPHAPRPSMEFAPKSVPVRISGLVRDLAGRPIAGATVHAIGARGWDGLRTEVTWEVTGRSAVTGADGRYRFGPVPFATQGLGELRKGFTPYVEFRVVAEAPGFGIGWFWASSMFAVPLPDPDDWQGRLALNSPAEVDLYLRPEAELKGRVVDEAGRPVAGVRVECRQVDLLDEGGGETRVQFDTAPGVLPGGFGEALTDGDGRFRLARLPAESCCWLRLAWPGSTMKQGFYASTAAAGPGLVHPVLPDELYNGRPRHVVYPAEMTLTMAGPRRLAVRVVAEDDGRPVPGIIVGSTAEDQVVDPWAFGVTDAEGRVAIDLSPGRYRTLEAIPISLDSRFISTALRPLVVAPGPAEQPLVLPIKAGSEVSIEVVDAATGRGISGVRFDIEKEGQAESRARLGKVDRFHQWLGDPTDADGKLHVTINPAKQGSWRVRVVGVGPDLPDAPPDLTIPRPPVPPGAPAVLPKGDPPRPLPYEVDPVEGEAFEPSPGKPITLRFRLRKK